MLRKGLLFILVCCFACRVTAEDSVSIPTDSVTLSTDSATTSIATLTDSVVAFAHTYLGTPYHYGANGSNGSFDCSGFVAHLFGLCGISLPHSSRAQYTMGQPVSTDSIQPGDLVFYQARRSTHVGHVGIIVEVDSTNTGWHFIHASTHGGVRVSHSAEPYYKKRFVGIKRL